LIFADNHLFELRILRPDLLAILHQFIDHFLEHLGVFRHRFVALDEFFFVLQRLGEAFQALAFPVVLFQGFLNVKKTFCSWMMQFCCRFFRKLSSSRLAGWGVEDFSYFFLEEYLQTSYEGVFFFQFFIQILHLLFQVLVFDIEGFLVFDHMFGDVFLVEVAEERHASIEACCAL
jgi:hypothetical protein